MSYVYTKLLALKAKMLFSGSVLEIVDIFCKHISWANELPQNLSLEQNTIKIGVALILEPLKL
jgi:hypothetical protein